jgi:sugar phosphate permease
MAFAFVSISIAALAGVEDAEQGLASGLINTSQQIGGALGIAVLSTIATTKAENGIAAGTDAPTALVDGFQAAFVVGGVVAAIGIVAAVVLVRGRDIETAPAAEPVTAAV